MESLCSFQNRENSSRNMLERWSKQALTFFRLRADPARSGVRRIYKYVFSRLALIRRPPSLSSPPILSHSQPGLVPSTSGVSGQPSDTSPHHFDASFAYLLIYTAELYRRACACASRQCHQELYNEMVAREYSSSSSSSSRCPYSTIIQTDPEALHGPVSV